MSNHGVGHMGSGYPERHVPQIKNCLWCANWGSQRGKKKSHIHVSAWPNEWASRLQRAQMSQAKVKLSSAPSGPLQACMTNPSVWANILVTTVKKPSKCICSSSPLTSTNPKAKSVSHQITSKTSEQESALLCCDLLTYGSTSVFCFMTVLVL